MKAQILQHVAQIGFFQGDVECVVAFTLDDSISRRRARQLFRDS
jgi:hypothetical protein